MICLLTMMKNFEEIENINNKKFNHQSSNENATFSNWSTKQFEYKNEINQPVFCKYSIYINFYPLPTFHFIKHYIAIIFKIIYIYKQIN